MPPLKDLSGQIKGRLKVIRRVGTHDGRALWLCECSCGKSVNVKSSSLNCGETQSCGCRQRDAVKATGSKNRRHGKHGTKVYSAWLGMIARCTNPNCDSYEDYGARGISVCREWLESFDAFYAEIGTPPTPAHSVDRKDSTRGYEPGNVRWATSTEQNRNRPRCNRILEHGGIRLCAAEWAERIGLPKTAMYARLRKGWPIEKIIATKLDLTSRRLSGVTPATLFHETTEVAPC